MKKPTTKTGSSKQADRYEVFCEYPLQRPNYFNGRLLTEADFTAEQEYHRRTQRCHNLHCHGVGVVDGLEVSVANDTAGWAVDIQPGIAIDPAGNEVHLCAAARFPLPNSGIEIQVGIRWVERPGGSIPAAFGDDAKTMPAYVEEGCEVILDPAVTRQSPLAKCSEGSVNVLPLARIARRGKTWRLDHKFKILRAR